MKQAISVKEKLTLVKQLLYLKEILDCGSISEAARKNGIKAPNLSKLMKETENTYGKELFVRTTHGISPTKESISLSALAELLNENIETAEKYFADNAKKSLLKLYVQSEIKLLNLENAEEKFVLTSDVDEADVIVSTCQYPNFEKLLVTEVHLNNNILSKVWVACQNTLPAVSLTRFIILRILAQ